MAGLHSMQGGVDLRHGASSGLPMSNYVFSESMPLTSGQSQNEHTINENDTIHHIISIPDAYVGSLIGRGGANISRIRSLTKCAIRIPPRTEGDVTGVRHVTVIGSPADVMNASMQISQACSVAQYASAPGGQYGEVAGEVSGALPGSSSGNVQVISPSNSLNGSSPSGSQSANLASSPVMNENNMP